MNLNTEWIKHKIIAKNKESKTDIIWVEDNYLFEKNITAINKTIAFDFTSYPFRKNKSQIKSVKIQFFD